ncbi:MAG: hypothetical protein WC213_02760 [Arenimonas sp.]|jgi:tetratricopeptide (TPR) repeat protein
MRSASDGFILGVALFLTACGPWAVRANDAVVVARTPPATSSALAQYRARLEAAKGIAFKGNHTAAEFAAVDRNLMAALADPLFGQLTQIEQGGAFSGAAWAAMRLGDNPRARDQFARATQLDPEDSDNWVRLAKLEYELHDHEAAAATMTRYARTWPELVDDEQDFVFDVIRKVDGQPRLDLLQTLFDNRWDPKPLGASDLWFQLALSRVLRDEPEMARAVIARITWPEMLIRLRSDKRFDALVDREAPQFNVERAASRRVDDLQVRLILDPTKLQNAVELSYAMLTEGMDEAVLDLTDSVLESIAADPGESPFIDADRRPWIINNRSIALRHLGRIDESLAELERAAKLAEDGHDNVSQVLNLSHLYCGLGRPDDALAAIAKTGSRVSGFGSMEQVAAKLCAAVLKGDQDGAAQALTYLREHREDNQNSYLWALIWANQMDEAAKSVIERLASQDDRDQMLYDMQDFIEPNALPAHVQLNERWHQLMVRDDVRKALDEVGRRQRYEIINNW